MKVLKPHNLPNRRLVPDQDVSEKDITGPLSVDDLKSLGILESDAPPPKKPAAAAKNGDDHK
jgi:hypothetical protein